MSLLEVLGGLALSMVVAFCFLYAINFFNKGVSGANKNDHIENAMLHVIAAFGSDDKYCTAILGGLSLSTSLSAGSTVSKIDYHDIDGVMISNVLTVGGPAEKNPELIVADIRLRPVAGSGPNVIIANLEVTFEKTKNYLGASTTTRTLPIYATMSGGKVKTCSTNPGGTIAVRRALCNIQSDGFDEYNVDTEKCEAKSNVRWFIGATPYAAKCGSGYRPAVSEKNPAPQAIVCRVDFVPGTFNPPPRTYSDGSVDDLVPPGAFSAKADKIPLTECKFAFQTGSNLTGVKAKIKCVPQ